jgi:hypothetical protein
MTPRERRTFAVMFFGWLVLWILILAFARWLRT